MKFKGAEFVEFLRRVLDYPRRDMLNATNPDFSELVNKTIATACGAKVQLAPETTVNSHHSKAIAKSGNPSKSNPLPHPQPKKILKRARKPLKEDSRAENKQRTS